MKEMLDLPADRRAALQAAGRGWIDVHVNLSKTVSEYAAVYRGLTGH